MVYEHLRSFHVEEALVPFQEPFQSTTVRLCDDDLSNNTAFTPANEAFKRKHRDPGEKTLSSLWRLPKQGLEDHDVEPKVKRRKAGNPKCCRVPTLHLAYGCNFRAPAQHTKDIHCATNVQALRASERFRADLPRISSASSISVDTLIDSCNNFYDFLPKKTR